MSIGTIVTIVLLMSVLILGIMLIQNIFESGKGVVDLTDEQLREELDQIFSEEEKLAIYPRTRYIEIKQNQLEGIGFGIKNLLEGVSGTKQFGYEVKVSDAQVSTKCGGITAGQVESWIITGKSENDIPIPSGGISTQKVLFSIPAGSPLCTIRFRVNTHVNINGMKTDYDTDFFDLTIKAK